MSELLQFDLSLAAESLVRLGLAFLLALPVALEREGRDKPLGLRTFPLVAMAATGYVMVGKSAFGSDLGAQARIIQGLITGVGFLGGGAIVKDGLTVTGTATAASIWTTAALGAAVAYNRYEIAVVLAVANFVILRWLRPLTTDVADRIGRMEAAVKEKVEEELDRD